MNLVLYQLTRQQISLPSAAFVWVFAVLCLSVVIPDREFAHFAGVYTSCSTTLRFGVQVINEETMVKEIKVEQAINAIKSMGGTVERSSNNPNKPHSVRISGKAFCDDTIQVADTIGDCSSSLMIKGTSCTSRGIARTLSRFRGVTSLYLFQMTVDAEVASQVAMMSNLSKIELHNADFTTELADALAQLPQLHSLSINGKNLDDQFVARLGTMQSLSWLSFGDSRITSKSLSSIGEFKSLQTLLMQNTDISDLELEELLGLKRLETLRLDGTKITDAGLSTIAKMSSLTTLYLNSTSITLGGLSELTDMPVLEDVSLENTSLSEREAFTFIENLPANRHLPRIDWNEVEATEAAGRAEMANKDVAITANEFLLNDNFGVEITGVHSSMFFCWRSPNVDSAVRGHLFEIDFDCDLTAGMSRQAGRVTQSQGQTDSAPTVMTPLPDGQFSYANGILIVETGTFTLTVSQQQLPTDGVVKGQLTIGNGPSEKTLTVDVHHVVTNQ